jgi:hypothetical protein
VFKLLRDMTGRFNTAVDASTDEEEEDYRPCVARALQGDEAEAEEECCDPNIVSSATG